MRGKKAKKLRRDVKQELVSRGLEHTIPAVDYELVPKRVEFLGSVGTVLRRNVSTKWKEKQDLRADLNKARRYNVLPNFLLQDLFGEPELVTVQRVLKTCQRSIYQRLKRVVK